MNFRPEVPSDIVDINRRLELLGRQLGAWIEHHRAELQRLSGDDARWWQPAHAADSARGIRRLVRRRRARAHYFGEDLFGDPAWDILLELTAARLEGVRVPISSLCSAAAVPTTTALRWINMMIESGLLVRQSDPNDRRRVFVELSQLGWERMNAFFSDMAADHS